MSHFREIIKEKIQNVKIFLGSLSIYYKVMLLVVLFIFLLGTLVSIFVYINAQREMTALQKSFGISLARDISSRSRHEIASGNLDALPLLVDEIKSSHPEVSYLVILDSRERIMARSFSNALPGDFKQINRLEPDKDYSVVAHETDQGRIYDIAVPLFENAGTVRLGINRIYIDESVKATVLNIIISTLMFCLLGLTAADILVRNFSKNVNSLQKAIESAGRVDFKNRISVNNNDEIGRLAQSVNIMLHELDLYQNRITNYQKQLEKKEEMQQQLINRLIVSQENERKRISLELYNQIGQLLTALKIGLKTITDAHNLEKIREIAHSLRDIAGETIDKVSSMALELRPSTLDHMGLVPAVQYLINEKFDGNGIKVVFKTTGLEEKSLPVSLVITVFRVIEEAFSNIINSAEAQNVKVELELKNHTFKVLIQDDGVGFDVEELFAGDPNKCLGLFGMQERISLIGGKITFDSAKNKRTTIEIKVPLPGRPWS